MLSALFITLISPVNITPEAQLAWLLAVALFSIGYFIAKNTYISVKYHRNQNINRFSARIIAVFLTIGLVGFVLGTLNTIEIAQSGPRGILYNIRAGRTKQHIGLGVASFLLPFLHIGVLMMIIRGYRARQYTPFAAFWLLSVGFTLARTKLLLCLLALTTAYYLRKTVFENRRVGVKPVVFLISVLGGGFIFIGSILDKLDSGALSGILFYFTIPITTFDESIRPLGRCVDSVFEAMTLYPLNRVFKKLGMSSTLQYQCEVPQGVAKSMLSMPVLDFGMVGVLVVPGVIGVFYGLVYSQVKIESQYMILFYSLAAFPLAISFYGYDFERVVWPYYLAIITALYVIEVPVQAVWKMMVDGNYT